MSLIIIVRQLTVDGLFCTVRSSFRSSSRPFHFRERGIRLSTIRDLSTETLDLRPQVPDLQVGLGTGLSERHLARSGLGRWGGEGLMNAASSSPVHTSRIFKVHAGEKSLRLTSRLPMISLNLLDDSYSIGQYGTSGLRLDSSRGDGRIQSCPLLTLRAYRGLGNIVLHDGQCREIVLAEQCRLSRELACRMP